MSNTSWKCATYSVRGVTESSMHKVRGLSAFKKNIVIENEQEFWVKIALFNAMLHNNKGIFQIIKFKIPRGLGSELHTNRELKQGMRPRIIWVSLLIFTFVIH